MICTPIFINTFVVFLRLYWFERRFQHIVGEARNWRRTRSRTRTEANDQSNAGLAEKSVRGRSIVVMRNGDEVYLAGKSNAEKPDPAEDLTSEIRTDSSTSHGENTENVGHASNLPPAQPVTFRREITFTDEINNTDNPLAPPRLPQRLNPEEHIAFLENQRNPKDKGALRIPSPRDVERGRVPEPLDEGNDGGQLTHQATSPIDGEGRLNGNTITRNVTIDEPERPRLRTNTGALSNPSARKSGTLENLEEDGNDEREPPPARTRTRTGTFSSLRRRDSKELDQATPYLSWQPTIGRNSAFVNLTEEQREELGGIEYRSLKTLAVVLVCESTSSLLFVYDLLIAYSFSVLCSIPSFWCSDPTSMDCSHRHLGEHCGQRRPESGMVVWPSILRASSQIPEKIADNL
jgi:hypothetical protein